MNLVTSLILRQMRSPFIVLISVLSIATLGMVLIPGMDNEGNPWRMDFFHALYFISYTATTIGFGEIPYPLTEAQRLWVLITIFTSVIAWFYAIGKIVSLIQTPMFKKAVTHAAFRRSLKQINEEFYLICGYGETGQDLVSGLANKHKRCVVIDNSSHANNELLLQDYPTYVPSVDSDAAIPDQLKQAGLEHEHCIGVVAVTNSDKINLKIAITSKLLYPEKQVVCRTEHIEYEENMKSFNTDYTVNPYDTFTHNFSLALRSPSLYLLNDWLTGVPDTKLSDPITIKEGHWVLCGFGRLGKRLFSVLKENRLSVTIIDPSPEKKEKFDNSNDYELARFIIGTGIDKQTLQLADIENAVGLVAGSNNDSNNLSIIMTGMMINKNMITVARQNELINQDLFLATSSDIILHPSEVVARKIRNLLTNPLLIEFLEQCDSKESEWANIAISRLSGSITEVNPHSWTIHINSENTPALFSILQKGRSIKLNHLMQDPRLRQKRLCCMPLMIKRENQNILLPELDNEIYIDDKILFCGVHEAELHIYQCMLDVHTLNYVMTFKYIPDSYIGRLVQGDILRQDRRNEPRKKPRHLIKNKNN